MAQTGDGEINILFEVTSAGAARVLVPLADACDRLDIPWACFFTGAGIQSLLDENVRRVAAGAVRAVACEHSWGAQMGDGECPVEMGSQTDNSTLAGQVHKIVSI